MDNPTGRNRTKVTQADAAIMDIASFRAACNEGSFIDYDGFAYPAVAIADGYEEDDSKEIWPSEVKDVPDWGTFQFPSWATHVAWYNR